MSLLSLSKKILKRETADTDKKPAKKAAPLKKTKKAKAQATASVIAGRLGMQPIITEKTIELQGHDTLVIRVKPDATKPQIASAIEDEFGQKPLAIRTARMTPKTRRRGATKGRTNHWKKAFVKVKDIQSLISKT
ncbi:MAG: 50S ribosomal protein L23 [Candidatus Andersenbacteria bacterium]